MTVGYLDPNGDGGTSQWSMIPVNGDHYTNINGGVRSPNVPNTDRLQASLDGKVETPVFTTLADVGDVSEFEVFAYCSRVEGGPTPPDIEVYLYVDGGWQAGEADMLAPPTGSYAWRSVSFLGSWDQTDVDDISSHLECVMPMGADVMIRELYIKVTYTEAGPAEPEGDADDLDHAHTLEAAAATQNHVVTPASLSHGQTLDSSAAAWSYLASPVNLAHAQTLDSTVGAWGTAGSPTDVGHAQDLDAPGITQNHVVTPDSLTHGHALQAASVESYTGAPADLRQAHSLDSATATISHVVSPDSLAHGQALDAVAAVVVHIASSAEVHHAHTLGSPSVSQQHVVSPEDLAHAQALAISAGFVEVALYLYVPPSLTRRLMWEETGTVYVVTDGAIYAESAVGYLDLPAALTVRGILIGYLDVPSPLPSPMDEVLLALTGDDVTHHVERKSGAEAEWTRLASILAPTYVDGPLADGAHHYRVVAQDLEGDTTPSVGTADVTVSSAPDPPVSFESSWNAETKTVTFTIGESPSADVDVYRILQSDAEGMIDLKGAPAYEGAGLTWQREFTDETGIYAWLARAVDTDGQEEQGITRVLASAFGAGAVTAYPAEPLMVRADPIAGGKVDVAWHYAPWQETGGPGAAFEARIYWDDATGTVDYSSPHATVAMGSPTKDADYSWQSGVLADGEDHLFVVRIGTAAHPDGVETQNTDEHVATPNADVPTTPTVTAQVI